MRVAIILVLLATLPAHGRIACSAEIAGKKIAGFKVSTVGKKQNSVLDTPEYLIVGSSTKGLCELDAAVMKAKAYREAARCRRHSACRLLENLSVDPLIAFGR